jgi:cytochrome c553
MRISAAVLAVLANASIAHAADIEAGKAKAAVVCAACHKPLDKASYTFTLNKLAEVAKAE